MKKFETKKMAVSAMLTALAFLVTFCTAMFKVGGFLSLDLKDAVLSIISLMYGPLYGFISVLVVSLVEFVTISTTGLYGLVMNILSSGTFVLVCGFIYKFKRKFNGAILASVLTVVCVTSVMLLANIFITPLYFQMPTQAVIAMLPTLLLPFNLFKSILNSSIMLLVYKPFTTALKKVGFMGKTDFSTYKFNKKSAILTTVAGVMIVVAVVVMLFLGVDIKN